MLQFAEEPIFLGEDFSARERRQAALVARTDPRIREALTNPEFGVTQVLAGAPVLVHAYEHADKLKRMVLDILVGAFRLGVESPLSSSVLRRMLEASSLEIATMLRLEELESALQELALPGAAGLAILNQVVDESVQVIGYRPSGYLLHYAPDRTLHLIRPIWSILSQELQSAPDLTRLGHAARERHLYAYAERFYRSAMARGSTAATAWLASLKAELGDFEQAIQLYSSAISEGDEDSRVMLALLLDSLGQTEAAERQLRQAQAQGDAGASYWLAGLRGDVNDRGGPRSSADDD